MLGGISSLVGTNSSVESKHMVRGRYIAIGALLIAAMMVCAASYYYDYSPPQHIPQLPGAATRAAIRLGDLDRTYLAHVPAQLPRTALLVLHGSFMNGEMMQKGTGYEFDVGRSSRVCCDLSGRSNWDDCRRTAGYPAKRLNIDDMSFLRAIIQRFGASSLTRCEVPSVTQRRYYAP